MDKNELKETIKEGVKEGVKAHVCHFEESERSVLKDIASGGIAFKKAIIYLLVCIGLAALGIKYLPNINAAKGFIGK